MIARHKKLAVYLQPVFTAKNYLLRLNQLRRRKIFWQSIGRDHLAATRREEIWHRRRSRARAQANYRLAIRQYQRMPLDLPARQIGLPSDHPRLWNRIKPREPDL